MMKNNEIKNETLSNEDCNVSKYRISTITITGSVNCLINLKELYDNIEIDSFRKIIYVEHGDNKYNQNCKGEKKRKNKTNTQSVKRFDNQLTMIYKFNGYVFNIKLFKNGNVQMTGVKDITEGEKMIDELIEFIKNINLRSNNEIVSIEEISKVQNINYKVRLINSDFKVNFEIKRDVLYRILLNVYNINCTYEPCIYPGVKIAYYVNEDDKQYNGICQCKIKCIGKKTTCKRITIAIFQSGCVIITGANTIEQINLTYKYISDILKNHMREIKRSRVSLELLNSLKSLEVIA